MATPDQSQSLLNELRGIHLPPPPNDDSLFVTILLLLLAVSGAWLIYSLIARLRRAQGWKQNALLSLHNCKICLSSQVQPDDAVLTSAAEALRSVVAQISRHKSQLTGDPYLRELDEIFQTTFFTKDAGVLFGESLYRSVPAKNDVSSAIDGAIRLIRKWK